MQLRPLLIAVCGAAAAGIQPASAACILASLNPVGTLGNPTENYTVMSSEAGGQPAGFTAVVTLGSATITVGAPTVSYTGSSPHSGDQGQVKYRAIDTLGFPVRQQDYTSQATSFGITTLLGTISATVNGKITNPTGFAQGAYQLKTVVTCS
jgi:hypothetical protein